MRSSESPKADRYARLANGDGGLNIGDKIYGHVPTPQIKGGDEGKRQIADLSPRNNGIQSVAYAPQLIDENGGSGDEAAVDVTAAVPLS